ncbi:MAG: hypothetical protein PVH00_05975 [Gemmatimonadota bacterium]|jgi:hypothetical protein
MSSANRLRASIIDLTFITWAVAVPLVLHTRLLNADGDFPRHVTMGEFILRGGPWQIDRFAHTHTGPFLTTEWLSQLTLALAHRAGGLAGVAVLGGLLVGAVYALLVAFMRRSRVEAFLAFVTALAAAVLGSPHWVARPHLFTFLGLALLLHLARHGRRWWIFAPFFAVWANFHGGFILGIAVLAAMALGEWIESRVAKSGEDRARWLESARRHALGVGAGIAGAMANPMGPGLLLRVRGILGNEFLLATTSEFQSINFHGTYGRVFLVVLLAILVALTLRSRRLSVPTLLVVGMTLSGALYARRNAPLFALVALPLLAVELDAGWRKLRVRGLERVRAVFDEGERVALPGRWAPWTAALLLVFALSGGGVAGSRLVPTGFDTHRFPVEAVAAARAAGLQGNIYNQFDWGGYLLYAWPEQRIFIDGMTDFLGNAVVRSYLAIDQLDPGWERELDRYDVSIVIVSPQARVVPALLRRGDWRTWHEDSTAVILVREQNP